MVEHCSFISCTHLQPLTNLRKIRAFTTAMSDIFSLIIDWNWSTKRMNKALMVRTMKMELKNDFACREPKLSLGFCGF